MKRITKKFEIVFPNIDRLCVEFNIYKVCPKKKKREEPSDIAAKRQGPTFSLLAGKTYELVIHSYGKTESGLFQITDQGIKIDKSRPPPITPSVITK